MESSSQYSIRKEIHKAKTPLGKVSTTFTHSGFAYSKRNGMLVLGNNATSIKQAPQLTTLEPKNLKVIRVFNCHTSNNKNEKRLFLNLNADRKIIMTQSRNKRNQLKSSKDKIFLCTSFSQEKKTKAKLISTLLHPELKHLTEDSKLSKPETQTFKKAKISFRTDIPFCRFNEFNKMPKYNRNTPCIGFNAPYKSRDDIINEEYKESKKKWITKKGFIVYGGKNCARYETIDNYVGKDPSEPPALHNFRTIDKKKWLSGSFKLV